VPKPSNGSAAVQVVVRAGGESRMMAAYRASMVHRHATAGEGAQQNSSRTWSRLDEPQLSLDGHHVVWSTVPPANDSAIELDGEAKRYAATKEFAFQLGLDCHGAEACVADGDTVETMLEVAESSSDGVRSAVRITTLVQALVSCEHSNAWIEYDLQSVPTSTAMRVHLEAYDVDRLPVSYNRAPVEFRFGLHLLPQRWDSGSNVYVADVSADLTENAGQYELSVTAVNGWCNRGQTVGRCELLRRSVTVAEKPSPVWFSVGSLFACAVFVGAIVFWARRMSAELRAVLVMVLTEASKTVLSISCELGDLATDLLTTYRVVFEDIVRSPQYRVPYAVFGCLAIMVGLVSLAHHVHRARGLHAQIKTNAKIQSQPAEAGAQLEDDEDDAHKAVVGKLEWELEKTSRDQQGLAVGVLCFFLEDLPMVRVRRQPVSRLRVLARQVVLTALLIFKEDIMDKTVR
jgi:hypothetical protein